MRAVRKGEHDPLSSSIWVVQPKSQGSHLKLSSMPNEHDCYLALSWGRRWGGAAVLVRGLLVYLVLLASPSASPHLTLIPCLAWR